MPPVDQISQQLRGINLFTQRSARQAHDKDSLMTSLPTKLRNQSLINYCSQSGLQDPAQFKFQNDQPWNTKMSSHKKCLHSAVHGFDKSGRFFHTHTVNNFHTGMFHRRKNTSHSHLLLMSMDLVMEQCSARTRPLPIHRKQPAWESEREKPARQVDGR